MSRRSTGSASSCSVRSAIQRQRKKMFHRPKFELPTSSGPKDHGQTKAKLGSGLTHPVLAKPAISLSLTALSLLLLVLVLLSVPGPIKGLYWFSVKGEEGESISAGVLGWCSESISIFPVS